MIIHIQKQKLFKKYNKDSKENRLLDFGIATEVKYAEIFAYKSPK